MVQLEQKPAQQVEELVSRATSHGQINVRFASRLASGEGTEQEDVSTTGVSEYRHGPADVTLV